MLRKNALTLALVAAIFALLIFYFRSEAGRINPNPPPASTPAPNPKPATQNPKLPSETPQSPLRTPQSARPAPQSAPPHPRSELADTLNSPATTITSDLRIVLEVLTAFRSNFPRDGNPVGSNPEITAVLIGRNALGLALIPPTHLAINRDGELCDRWGTPFFFHAESAARMTVQSAGPDKKLHTPDDVALSP